MAHVPQRRGRARTRGRTDDVVGPHTKQVYPSGKICLDIISDKAWKPSVTVKQILLGIQMLLKEPNNSDPANSRAYTLFNQKAKYKVEVRKQAKKYPLPI